MTGAVVYGIFVLCCVLSLPVVFLVTRRRHPAQPLKPAAEQEWPTLPAPIPTPASERDGNEGQQSSALWENVNAARKAARKAAAEAEMAATVRFIETNRRLRDRLAPPPPQTDRRRD